MRRAATCDGLSTNTEAVLGHGLLECVKGDTRENSTIRCNSGIVIIDIHVGLRTGGITGWCCLGLRT
jgi:hypothetical protein